MSARHEAASPEGGRDLSFFDPPAIDRLLGVVLELAAQVNEERYRRLALERVLAQRGVLDPVELEALGADRDFEEHARGELERAVERLFVPIVSDGHPLRPLRGLEPRERRGAGGGR
ncbi:MAG TPA: hypothetical protein VKV23_01095 [Acidimicrobiales bacterium]|nr:hypothetical protein [Acidimicrobiales bacterium]